VERKGCLIPDGSAKETALRELEEETAGARLSSPHPCAVPTCSIVAALTPPPSVQSVTSFCCTSCVLVRPASNNGSVLKVVHHGISTVEVIRAGQPDAVCEVGGSAPDLSYGDLGIVPWGMPNGEVVI